MSERAEKYASKFPDKLKEFVAEAYDAGYAAHAAEGMEMMECGHLKKFWEPLSHGALTLAPINPNTFAPEPAGRCTLCAAIQPWKDALQPLITELYDIGGALHSTNALRGRQLTDCVSRIERALLNQPGAERGRGIEMKLYIVEGRRMMLWLPTANPINPASFLTKEEANFFALQLQKRLPKLDFRVSVYERVEVSD